MDRFESALVACLLTPVGGDPSNRSCQWGIVPNFIGGSGIGKSERINTIARAIGLNCYPIYAATKTPEHIGGFPAPTEYGFMLRCALPQVISAINDQRALIYLDEISTAPPAVQAALLSFVNERTVGEYALPYGVRIAMAMNPAESAANGHDLEIPMANRVAHFDYTPPPLNQWLKFMRREYVPDVPNIQDGESVVKQGWRTHFPVIMSLAEGFMLANGGKHTVKREDGTEEEKSKLYDQPDSTDPRASGPWPSHRTWSWALYGMTTVRCLGLPTAIEIDLVSALVGKGLAAEWASYVSKMDLPQPEDVLTKGWTIPRRLDVARTVFTSCAAFVTTLDQGDPRQQALAIACWDLMGRAITTMGFADIIVLPAQMLIRAGLDATSCRNNPALVNASNAVCGALYEKGHLRFINGGA